MYPAFLTQSTPFIGRASDIANVQRLLADPSCRLLTITGLGGSGKTRLATEVMHTAAPHFQHGVIFVPLQSLAKSELLVPAIAQAAGLTFYISDEPEAQLLNFLHEKSLLLVLDNFEHLLSGVELISNILAHTSEVKILVTSRETLNVQNEWLYPLTGMNIPPSVYATTLQDYEAVQLFLYHAQRVQPGFDLKREHQAVIQICRLTEGLPLAIELVATSLKGVSASQVVTEIQNNLDFLSTRIRDVVERHRSMRAVFDQSWHLLSEDERLVFAKLSVFRGGFDAKAAEAIAGAALSILSGLVEKSLLRVSDASRFDIHELLRQYAETHLNNFGLSDVTREAHSSYYMKFLSNLSRNLAHARQQEALQAISNDFENTRAAWDCAVQTKQLTHLNAAVESLFTFYDMRSRLHEGDELLAAALDTVPDDPYLRCRLLAYRASIKTSLGDYRAALALAAESIGAARDSGFSKQLAYSLNLLARIHCYLGDFAEAERVCQHSLSLYTEQAEDWGKARCMHVLGFIQSRTGNIKAAQEYYRKAVQGFRALDDLYYLNTSLINLGVMCATLSENVEARLIFEESLEIAQQLGNRLDTARALDHLGMLLVWGIKDYEGAKLYYEQSLAIRHDIGDLPGAAHTLNNIADVAAKVGDFASAQQLYSEAMTVFQRLGDPWNIAIALAGLGDAAAGLQQYDDALEYLRAALQKSVEIQARVLTLSLFVSVVILFTKTGKWELAIILTALIIHHPDSPPGLKTNAREIFNESAATRRPPVRYSLDQTTEMRMLLGQHLNELAQILNLPLEYLNALASVFRTTETAPLLNDPLTQRELEILHLMAGGLTNPQIAERLVIGAGTVKTHTLSIYRKLDVANRTQAIIRAQELGLLPA